MLSCKRTSFSDISGDRRFRFSDNTLPEVLNTRSLLIHDAGADKTLRAKLLSIGKLTSEFQ